MNLSGQLIKGTGSFEVKEIAPIKEFGELIANGRFLSWTNDVPDSWVLYSPPSDALNYVTEVADGAMISRATNAIGIQQSLVLTSGRHYIVEIDTTISSGKLSLFNTTHNLISTSGLHRIKLTADITPVIIYAYDNGTDAVIHSVSIEEVPEGYPLMDKGDTYLECTSSGTVAFPSTQAYGEWEWSWYHGDGHGTSISFIRPDVENTSIGYDLTIRGSEQIRLRRDTVSQFETANDYTVPDTWYRVKITRTLDGEFYVYIKGGDFGTDDWTLIVISTGSNPVTENNYTESRYLVMDIDAGDRIKNITVKKKGVFVIDDPSVVSGEWIDGANSGVWDDGVNSGVWSDNI